MKHNILNSSIIPVLVILLISACSKKEEAVTRDTPFIPIVKKDTVWVRVFTDDFTSSTTLASQWSKADRFDYNSTKCKYVPTNPIVSTFESKSCLTITATQNGTIWNSGLVKSEYSFMPGENTEYRTSAYIKLCALNGTTLMDFKSTYGLWPAFWTVGETNWPVNGEMDIMEGYSFGGTTRFTNNLFYGTKSGENLMGISCEKKYTVSEGWHLYEQNWKNVNGTVTITAKLDGVTTATYTNESNTKLRLENFGLHNIILNLNVGATTWNAFDNSKINVFTKSMMYVDYVYVDKRNL